MITVRKHPLRSVYLTTALPAHADLKPHLLQLLSEAKSESIVSQPTGPSDVDNITRLDWSQNEDFDRPWAKLFMGQVAPIVGLMVRAIGFADIKILQLWYQQYRKADTHGWHGHSYNFTGVYYVELPDDAPRTQLVDPETQGHIFTPAVNEGDILLFPSYTIHRAPTVTSDTRKTIVSFNFDLKHFSTDCYASLAAAEMRLSGVDV
jgi:hypothetical protein